MDWDDEGMVVVCVHGEETVEGFELEEEEEEEETVEGVELEVEVEEEKRVHVLTRRR